MSGQYVKIAIASCLIMSAMVTGTVCFGFFLDPVTSDLGFDRSSFSLYFSLVTIVGTISMPFYGRIMEKVGTRKVVIAGGIWTGIAMACFSLCRSLPAFYLTGCLVGLGFFGCSYAAVPVIVSSWFHEKQSFVMGLAGACGGAISMVMSLVFPTVIEMAGWSTGYILLSALVAILTVPAGLFLLKSRPSDVGLEPYGGHETVEQATADTGLSYRQALKTPQLWMLTLVFAVLGATIIVTQHLPAYFTGIGFSSLLAGVFMSVISAGIIFTNAIAGAATDKAGFLRAFVLFSVLYAASFAALPLTMALPVICIALVLMSIGNANLTVFAPAATQRAFGKRDYAAIWGIVSMACVFGQAVGAPLWGLAYDLMGSYQPAMYLAAALVVLCLLAVIVCLRTLRDATPSADDAAASAEPKRP